MSPYIEDVSRGSEEDSLRSIFPYIDADPATLPLSLDPFTITNANGFMPLRPPTVELPPPFGTLTKLAEDLSVVKLDGSPGLLATYQLGPAIDKHHALPDLVDEIDNLIADDGMPNLAAITAVFREYAFIASAYLLEPCWERQNKGLEGFGLGRQVLPRCIAGPLVKTARLLGIHPFMSYAAAYCLFNYRFADPTIGASEYSNLLLIRAFEKGLDPASSEAGFVLVHLDMVKHSGGLIKGTVDILTAIESRKDRSDVVDGFETMLDSMQHIEASMETMWTNSKPKDYNTYRTFIFGITNQPMFNGVIYEGENNNEPLHYRGESGANDSKAQDLTVPKTFAIGLTRLCVGIIPLLDSLLEIPMPQNELTEILKDFRSYRPQPHREFLAYVRRRACDLKLRDYCCGDIETAVLYLRLLEHVRSFRWRHWLFAREYIIRRTNHPTATGGSPIVTWLPNQLQAVMALQREVWDAISEEDKQKVPNYIFEMMADGEDQRDKLQKEVDRWCTERGVSAT